jgi:hypothetical protein
MNKITFLLVIAVALSACGPAATGSRDGSPDGDNPVSSDQDTPVPSDLPYAVKAGDANLSRGNVFIDSTDLVIRESYPPQIALVLAGGLPTPCHQLRVVVSPPDLGNRIDVEVYSVVDPAAICIQVIEAFSQTVEMGTYASGHYTVFVNGELAGEFDS